MPDWSKSTDFQLCCTYTQLELEYRFLTVLYIYPTGARVYIYNCIVRIPNKI